VFVILWRPLWREDGSVIYCRYLASPAQFLSGLSPAGLIIIFYCPNFWDPPTRRARSRIYIPQEQGGPVILLGTGFPFRCFLRLRWRYSNPHTGCRRSVWPHPPYPSVASVRKRTIPTERPPFVSKVSANFLRIEVATWSAWRILGFLDRSRYFFFQVAPQLYSRGWVDPVLGPLLFFYSARKSNPGPPDL
jgi:hypothetical protein